jgi:hypothetical protein
MLIPKEIVEQIYSINKYYSVRELTGKYTRKVLAGFLETGRIVYEEKLQLTLVQSTG